MCWVVGCDELDMRGRCSAGQKKASYSHVQPCSGLLSLQQQW